ncbi:multicopper oxidase [Melanomma pulvis-pyrius CBS 109.77]|uniref:Multicopper oxidase n=1 Tax=Melanomma pulvis-pyrius CBS 109.77 TaxID=1314802 RepID=A0A6A6X5U7_9PLEO|nr:multicopper oxidase [Melanomma pulvis-pyrius CBS 109.77]
MLLHNLVYWLSLSSLAISSTVPRKASHLKPSPVVVERQASTSTRVPDGQCTNGPRTRNCWDRGFSIATDPDAKAPPAGKVVTYNLEITNTTLNPDGNGDRLAMLINGQFPGPLIRASWGDTLVINVKNLLENNGTGIHWHGIRQLGSVQNDGVPGVTECPIAPGKTRQYRFKCTQFGTTWYHSHWSSQYAEGVVGTLIIDGPATANYDEDLGTLPLSDWYYKPGFELNEQAQHSQTGPPEPDNLLVNGTHINANGGGKYFKMNVVKGKKYRIRLINTSVDSVFSLSMDNHPFTVITSDFVPIQPYVTDQITMNIGQRYDVIINANQTAGNYWLRVSPGCGKNKIQDAGVPLGAILHYSGAPEGNPNSTGVTMRTTCNDETNLVPFVINQVPRSVVPAARELALNRFVDQSQNFLFRWTLNGSTQIVNWETPSLQTALEGKSNYGNNSNVHEMKNADGWYLWWIQTTTAVALPHPIHLHGHDFYLLGKGDGV